MIKFLHISDVHLGCRRYNLEERTKDFFRSWYDVIEHHALPNEVDFVLIAGDFFDRRNIDPQTMNHALAGLQILKDAGIPVVAIEGNHDRREAVSDYSWMRSFSQAGFIILLDRSLRLGDMINVSGNQGTVTQIRTRYTVVRGLDGIETLIPNEKLITDVVQNHSSFLTRGNAKIAVQVSYRCDVERAMQLLVEATQGVERVLQDPAPAALLSSFGADGINLELSFWIEEAVDVHHAGEGGGHGQVAGPVAAGGAVLFEFGGDDRFQFAGEAGQIVRVDVFGGAQQDLFGGVPVGLGQVLQRGGDDPQLRQVHFAGGVCGGAVRVIHDPFGDLDAAGCFPGGTPALLGHPAPWPQVGGIPARAGPVHLLDGALDHRIQPVGQREQPLGEVQQVGRMHPGQRQLPERSHRAFGLLQYLHRSPPTSLRTYVR